MDIFLYIKFNKMSTQQYKRIKNMYTKLCTDIQTEDHPFTNLMEIIFFENDIFELGHFYVINTAFSLKIEQIEWIYHNEEKMMVKRVNATVYENHDNKNNNELILDLIRSGWKKII